jgi:hypothetical protein
LPLPLDGGGDGPSPAKRGMGPQVRDYVGEWERSRKARGLRAAG